LENCRHLQSWNSEMHTMRCLWWAIRSRLSRCGVVGSRQKDGKSSLIRARTIVGLPRKKSTYLWCMRRLGRIWCRLSRTHSFGKRWCDQLCGKTVWSGRQKDLILSITMNWKRTAKNSQCTLDSTVKMDKSLNMASLRCINSFWRMR
jgi:hypothetical protein